MKKRFDRFATNLGAKVYLITLKKENIEVRTYTRLFAEPLVSRPRPPAPPQGVHCSVLEAKMEVKVNWACNFVTQS